MPAPSAGVVHSAPEAVAASLILSAVSVNYLTLGLIKLWGAVPGEIRKDKLGGTLSSDALPR
jgi:hypothetical protein